MIRIKSDLIMIRLMTEYTHINWLIIEISETVFNSHAVGVY